MTGIIVALWQKQKTPCSCYGDVQVNLEGAALAESGSICII